MLLFVQYCTSDPGGSGSEPPEVSGATWVSAGRKQSGSPSSWASTASPLLPSGLDGLQPRESEVVSADHEDLLESSEECHRALSGVWTCRVPEGNFGRDLKMGSKYGGQSTVSGSSRETNSRMTSLLFLSWLCTWTEGYPALGGRRGGGYLGGVLVLATNESGTSTAISRWGPVVVWSRANIIIQETSSESTSVPDPPLVASNPPPLRNLKKKENCN